MTPASDWRNWTVAITGMNARADNPGPGMAVARCLRESPEFRGRIVGLGYDALDPGLYHDGMCDASYLLPYPSTGVEALLARLEEVHAEQRIDLVIPCLDAELANFIQAATRLEALGIRAMLPTRVQMRERSKDRLAQLCQRLSIDVPETRALGSPAFFDRCAAEGWDYPLVVKGVYYDAVVVHGPAEARHAFGRIAAQWGYPVLVQKFVAGHEVNLTALGDGRGGMVLPVMMRKRAVTDKGKAWAGISILDDGLQSLAARLMEELCWKGPLEVEALRGEDGRLYLIEVNPRLPAWVYLTHGVGRNLPEALLRLAAGERPRALPSPRPGTLFIRHAEELIVGLEAFEAMLTAGRLPMAAAEAAA